ncbi:MAG: hypothetical protein Q9164_005947 [Protoblastenia rupestris]
MPPHKPTVVIVPGGWHPTSSYSSLASALDKAGYPSLTTELPSFNPVDPSNTSCTADADFVRQQILPLIETDKKEVIMLPHSYGGIPAGGAARGLSKKSRSKKGIKGGVIGLLYMSAFVVPEGQSLLDIRTRCGPETPRSPCLRVPRPTPCVGRGGVQGETRVLALSAGRGTPCVCAGYVYAEEWG